MKKLLLFGNGKNKKVFLLPLWGIVFLLVPFVFSDGGDIELGGNYSLDGADYIALTQFNQSDSSTIQALQTGQAWVESNGDSEIKDEQLYFDRPLIATTYFLTNLSKEYTTIFTIDWMARRESLDDSISIQLKTSGGTGRLNIGTSWVGGDDDNFNVYDYDTSSATYSTYNWNNNCDDTTILARIRINTTGSLNVTIYNVTVVDGVIALTELGTIQELASNYVKDIGMITIFQDGRASINTTELAIYNGTVRPTEAPPSDTTPPTINCSFNVSLANFYENTVVNFSCTATDEIELSTLNMTWNYTTGIVYSNYTVTTPAYKHNITTIPDSGGNVINFTGYATDTSGNVKQNSTLITIQPIPAPVVTITYPSNDDTQDNNTYPLWINGTVTVSGGVVNLTWINNTNWRMDSGSNASFGFSMNGTIVEFENNIIMIFANNSDGRVGNSTVYFDTDFTNPLAKSPLSTNNTFYYSQINFTYQINFTDTRHLYSFNISTPQGYFYNITGLNTTLYIYNGSINISNTTIGENNLTAWFCDAHTKKKIKDWNNEIDNIKSEIRFNFGEKYFLIRPLDKTKLKGASTKKEEDRYTFTFQKNNLNKKNDISFMVLSSEKIDIIGNTDKYSGWLVIYKLGKWIDFNIKDRKNIKYEITRVSDNSVIIEIKGIKDDTFTFNSAGDLNCMKETYKYYVFNHSVIYDSNAISNTLTNIKLVIDFEDLKVNTTGFLTYNSTVYTVSNVSSATQINYSINITPQQYLNTTTNITFNWNYTLNNIKYNTISYKQIVSSIFLTRWGNLSNASAINFTIYNEETNAIMEGDVTGTFDYTEGTVTFDELDSTNFSLAIFPAGASTSGDYSIIYSATEFTERRYVETSAVYSNNTQTIKLYLLNTSLGGSATFRILDIYSSPITDVTGKMEKVIGGSLVTVEQQTSDGSGLMTFFVNPDDYYTFTFSKTGYVTYSVTIRPITKEIYTIPLQAEGTDVIPSYSTEIKYFFTPTNTVLNNGTAYDFTFNLTSGYWDIEDCTLYLKNGSVTLNSSSSSFTTRDCFITLRINTGNQTTIISEAEYTLNSTVTRVSVQYSVQYTYKGEFSLMNFIDDIRAFNQAGFNDFTRMIIVFIIIFSVVAYASSQLEGLREPETLIVLTWALVLIFSYLGFLTLNYAAIPDIQPVGREWVQQYIIFILITLGAGSYLIRRHL